MAFDVGEALNKVLTSGLDIWVDTEKARNYTPGAQTVGQRDNQGGTMPAGQPAMVLPAWANNPYIKWGAVAAGILVVVWVARKL